MIQHSSSWWGIKNSREDITSEIMRIINDADSFIIVCGYNFTFNTSAGARPFFDALRDKSLAGVQCLLIFPPNLHSAYNPQPNIINHCLTNNLPIILNHQNHSKWLLTDKDLYYGSSNFTNASWKNRVEVLSIHEHTFLGNWAQQTIKDFKTFIDTEIADLNRPARRMKTYRGLLTSTKNAWKSIGLLVHKFNPSIEKVIKTLANYDQIISILNKEVVNWFDSYSKREFEIIYNLSSKILITVDRLCEYAYGNIYNETIKVDNIEKINQSVINGYNRLYQQVLKNVEECVEGLSEERADSIINSEVHFSNLQKINSIKQIIDETIK